MADAESLDRIDQCPNCAAILPLRKAAAKEPAHLWECITCGAQYRGAISQGATIASLRNVRCVHRAAAITVPAV